MCSLTFKRALKASLICALLLEVGCANADQSVPKRTPVTPACLSKIAYTLAKTLLDQSEQLFKDKKFQESIVAAKRGIDLVGRSYVDPEQPSFDDSDNAIGAGDDMLKLGKYEAAAKFVYRALYSRMIVYENRKECMPSRSK